MWILQSNPSLAAADIDDMSLETLYISSLQIRYIIFSFSIMLLDVLQPKTLKKNLPDPEIEPSGSGRHQDNDRKKV
jgi:hypothetical protein